jgi:hypothetical protein
MKHGDVDSEKQFWLLHAKQLWRRGAGVLSSKQAVLDRHSGNSKAVIDRHQSRRRSVIIGNYRLLPPSGKNAQTISIFCPLMFIHFKVLFAGHPPAQAATNGLVRKLSRPILAFKPNA